VYVVLFFPLSRTKRDLYNWGRLAGGLGVRILIRIEFNGKDFGAMVISPD